jgi:hydrogenase maturation protease
VLNATDNGPCRAWVVGLGTTFGDDRAGWEVVAGLGERLPAGVRCGHSSDPLAVLDAPPGCELMVVIDACQGAGPLGSVHRFVWPDPRLVTVGGVSSHGVGLAAALELAATLGRLPPKVVILSVEGTRGDSGPGLSSAVEAALPEVVARALAEIGL